VKVAATDLAKGVENFMSFLFDKHRNMSYCIHNKEKTNG
jgi:hypothetical protein